MATPASLQYIQIIDTTGPRVGATIEYYDLSNVAQAVYSDADLMTSLGATLSGANASDSKGRFPIHWLDPSLSYKRIIKLSDGSTWRTDNPVQTADTELATALADYVKKDGTIDMTGALNFAEGAVVVSDSSIDLDAMTGNTAHVSGTATIGTMTLQQGAWRILIFNAACTLTNSANLICFGGADITTVAGDSCFLFGEGGGVTRMLAYSTVDGVPVVERAEILIAVGDESTPITTGTAKLTFRMPFAITLDAIPRASLTTASSSGLPTVDVKENGTTIFSTLLSVNANQLTSTTASTPAVLSDTSLADDAQMTVDITIAGTGATGLKLLLRGKRRNR